MLGPINGLSSLLLYYAMGLVAGHLRGRFGSSFDKLLFGLCTRNKNETDCILIAD